jgi:ATP-dependent DNA ligase
MAHALQASRPTDMALPFSPPLARMLATLARDLPQGDWIFAPKWDGFLAIAFRDRDAVDIRSRHDRRLDRYVALANHSREHGFGLDRSPSGRLHGAAGRCLPDEMTRDWIPVRATLVCEVASDTVDGKRMRHPARFVRWRPDREAASCRIEQLQTASAVASVLPT